MRAGEFGAGQAVKRIIEIVLLQDLAHDEGPGDADLAIGGHEIVDADGYAGAVHTDHADAAGDGEG